MVCPSCRTVNPDNLKFCTRCSTPLNLGDVTLPLMDTGPVAAPVTAPLDPNATQAMGAAGTAWSQPASTTVFGDDHSGAPLETGVILAGRYEIVKLLGEGGMGAVYRAHDRELDRVVALKVIRPELARNAQVLQRFKQELILARQVTHRNIIRIFDLGQAEGVRFITMEYIEGEDLSQILARRGKLPAAEATAIMTQVTRGLEAAHTEGVVHRDLKPQNIMMEASGKASVMDFGIARSMDASSMTRTGALMGTPTYMSPEQAQGHKVDARSDLYTLGIIFYELLTGRPPFETDNPMATLVKRIQEKPVPPIQVEPSIPRPVNDLVMKMLATKPEERQQSACELLLELDAIEAQRTGRTVAVAPVSPADRGIPIKYVAAAMLLVTALGVYLFTRRIGPVTPPAPKNVSVLVSDFQNATKEAVFDGTLEPTFSLALEGASFISTYSRGDARKAAQRIQAGAAQLDEKMAQLVATSEGINYVISGAIEGTGGKYTIRARVIDPATGKSVVEKSANASSKQDVLNAAGKLATPIRKALGDTNPERATETYSSSSLEAAQAYARGQDFQWAQNYEEAIKSYQQALSSDPEMGRAYAGLAASHANSFHLDDADKYYKLAMSKTGRMTEREQYRTRGAYYLFTRNYHKAIDEFTALTKQFPADDAGRINLATAFFYSRNFEGARQEGQRAIAISPNNVLYRSNSALFAMYAGQFDDAIKTAAVAIKLNPGSTSPYIATALSQFALGKLPDAEATYKKLAATGARGTSRAAAGLADMALYEGRITDAVAILEAGIKTDLADSPKSSAAASKLATLAGATRNRAQAVDAAEKALAINSTAGFAFGAARVLIEAGQEARALEVARKMGAELAPELRAWSKLIEGEIQLRHGKSQAAIDLFQEAQKLADTWIGRLDLGRAYLAAGHFPEAASEFDACEKRKGEATSVFFDDVPSFRYYPQIHYYRGQVQEGLKSPDSAALFQNFLTIKAKAEAGDPMVEDARKRTRP
jgi:tetratricopeptide (TPR) repeat protein/predicted Ser/Thr protein kinase